MSGMKVDFTDKIKKNIREAFNILDPEGTGLIEPRDFKVALRALGFEPTKPEVKRLMSGVKKDAAGRIALDAFTQLIVAKVNERDTKDEILKTFQLFDDDNTGVITFDNLKRVAAKLGETVTDEELMEMVWEADKDGDKEIDKEEFLKLMQKTRLY